MVGPKEGDVVCDPASGSGGFLIRFFEIVREEILADVDRKYQAYLEEIKNENLTEEQRANLLRKKHEELQETLDSKC
jgi:type I restriction enzyme M protein